MAERVASMTGRPARPASAPPSQAGRAPTPPSPDVKQAKRAADATSTLELIGAGLTLFSMMSGARAKHTYETATDEKIKAKAAKSFNSSQTMQLDAAALQIHAENTGMAVAQAASQNSLVASLVDRLEMLNGVGAVAVSALPLVYQIMANHAPSEARENMPPELMQLGVLPPNMLLEKLKSQNEAKMARMQAEILREQKAAQDELRDLQEELAKQNGHAPASV